MPLLLVLLCLAVAAGCSNIGNGNANGTRAGTTNIQVTGTSGSLTHSTGVTLTVN